MPFPPALRLAGPAQTASVWAELVPDSLQQLALRLQTSYMASNLGLCSKAAEAILRPESRLTALFPSHAAFEAAEGHERTPVVPSQGVGPGYTPLTTSRGARRKEGGGGANTCWDSPRQARR